MTHKELHKLPFHLVSHISFGTEHMAVYQAETSKGSIVLQTHTRKRKKGEVANSYADAECYDKVKKNISKLNSSRYGSY